MYSVCLQLWEFSSISYYIHLLVLHECTQSCPALYNPMDCSLPGSCVHGILQARILEWVAVSFSRVSSQLRDQTQVSCITCTAGRFFTCWTRRFNTYTSLSVLKVTSLYRFFLLFIKADTNAQFKIHAKKKPKKCQFFLFNFGYYKRVNESLTGAYNVKPWYKQIG